jgi:hypothetical protein
VSRVPEFDNFFNVLNQEIKKASDFFEQTEELFLMRVQRVRDGVEIMKRSNFKKANTDAQLKAALTVVWLYKDLLSLETFAIMTFCCFSKILKKLDKKSGFNLGLDFLNTEVKSANFTDYPRTMKMIQATHVMFEEVTDQLSNEEKLSLRSDESLFIDTITRLNAKAYEAVERRSLPFENAVKLNSFLEIHTPEKNMKTTTSPLSLRSKIMLLGRKEAENIQSVPETASEYVTLASFAATSLDF